MKYNEMRTRKTATSKYIFLIDRATNKSYKFINYLEQRKALIIVQDLYEQNQIEWDDIPSYMNACIDIIYE